MLGISGNLEDDGAVSGTNGHHRPGKNMGVLEASAEFE